jgi:hypothetical protein
MMHGQQNIKKGTFVSAALILNLGARRGERSVTEKNGQSSTGHHISKLSLYENTRTSNFFCGDNVLTESMFVTQLSTNVKDSV